MTRAVPAPGRPSWPRLLGQGAVAPVAPRTLQAVVHVLVDPFAALITSLPVILAALVTVSTLPLVPVAIICFALLLVGSWLEGHVERFRIAALTGVEISVPDRRVDGPWYTRVVAWVRSGATWKELGYHLIHLPKAVVFAAIVLAVWSLGLALTALPFYVGASPAGRAKLGWWAVDPGAEALLAGLAGVVVLLTAPWVTRGLSRLSIGVAEGLLGGSEAAELRERVEAVEASRADVVDAAEVERRRIERDLHDGAQQRLVALAMSLGLAKEKLDSDPEAARALVDEAHREAKHALVELRDLARGLHPPVLTDRGLRAAVAGLASRAPVPVDVDIRVERRAPPSIEGIAYFVISEALTNVARHSGAARARVLVADEGRHLVVEVVDDGIGGARLAPRSGLQGLQDRVRAVDGAFAVSSPTGGPTTIRAELPLPVLAAAPSPGAAPPGSTDATTPMADVTRPRPDPGPHDTDPRRTP